jgi:hypothetical protein
MNSVEDARLAQLTELFSLALQQFCYRWETVTYRSQRWRATKAAA